MCKYGVILLKNLWNKCLLELKKYISIYEFNIWILPLQVLIYNNIINLYSPNKFVIKHIKKNYLIYINNFFLKYWKYKRIKPILNFLIGSINNSNKNNLFKNNFIYLNSKKNKYNSYDFKEFNNFNLLKKYSFDNFIYNKSNIYAYKKSIKICNLNSNFKYLFIYSKVGLGKTHLLNSIGNRINYLYNGKKSIFYINMKVFLSKIEYFLYKNLIENFIFYLKSFSIFLIDDIQFLYNKKLIQNKFLNIFNMLFKYNKFIILTSNCNVNKLKGINNEIISKLYYNFVFIKINNCDINLRYKFLISKCKYINFCLDKKILYFISEYLNSNFYELENILYLIYVNAINLNYINKININFIKYILYKFILNNSNYNLNVKIYDIQKVVCNYYNITIDNLLSKYRYKSFVWPRQISIAISKKLTNYSLIKLGLYFGGLSNSYILYSYNKIKKLYMNNSKVKLEFNNLIKLIVYYKNEIYYKKKKIN